MQDLQNDENDQHGKINTTPNFRPSVKINQKETTEEISDNESASHFSPKNKNQDINDLQYFVQDLENNDEIENLTLKQK